MNFQIDVLNRIKKENINPYQYTVSLLQEGYRVNVFDQKMIVTVQKEISFILKKLILKYTKKESTSVKIETAGKIYSSILYALDAELSDSSNLDESVEKLLSNNINDIYEAGMMRLECVFKDMKQLFETVKGHKLKIPLKVYHSSIEEAIPQFFRNYNLKYDALNTMTILDYPLAIDDMKFNGLVYMKNYLKHLKLETDFIRYFRVGDVITTLENFGHTYNFNYKETPFNIFEIVLNNAIFASTIKDDVRDIIITRSEYNLLKEMFFQLTHEEINQKVGKSIHKITSQLSIQDDVLKNYIQRYKHKFVLRLKNAIKHKKMKHLIITEQEVSNQKTMVLYSKDSMSNNEFIKLVSYIKGCKEIRDKIDVIKSNIKSLDDLIDLLSSSCLFGNEYTTLYNELGNLELSVLGRLVLYEELREGSFILDNINKVDVQYDWEEQFIKFICDINQNQKEEIEHLMNNHHIELL